MLNDVEEKLLEALYDMKFNNGKEPKDSDFDLVEKDNEYKIRRQEITSYLLNLQRRGYISVGHNAFHSGGRKSEKYRNSTLIIYYDRIEIIDLGIKYVENLRKTNLDKVKETVTKGSKWLGIEFLKKFGDKLVGLLVIAILTVIFTWLGISGNL